MRAHTRYLDQIKDLIAENIQVKELMLQDEKLLGNLATLAEMCIHAFENDKKVLLCGNGGSAADAQHIAAELSGRFYNDRPPLYAEALHVNSSYLTAVANDYGYDAVFSRMVQAAGRPGDILLAFSTSGNSENICQAVKQAHTQGMKVGGFTGMQGGKLANLADICIQIPSNNTPRIQEGHILAGHMLCAIIELDLFPII